jgi:hypothetical protein
MRNSIEDVAGSSYREPVFESAASNPCCRTSDLRPAFEVDLELD